MSDLQTQFDQEVQAHNEVHAQIQAAEEQLVALRVERERRYGRLTVLQEQLQAEQAPEEVAEEGSDDEPVVGSE